MIIFAISCSSLHFHVKPQKLNSNKNHLFRPLQKLMIKKKVETEEKRDNFFLEYENKNLG